MAETETPAKVELGSQEWLALAESFLAEHIPALGAVVAGVSFSMCEAFSHAPAHLADDEGRAAWWFAIAGPSVTVGRGARDDVDVRVDVDYEQVLPSARQVNDVDAPVDPERAVARRAALGDRAADAWDALPAEVRACLTGLHNFLAPRTA
jgi:hypothetical protein